MAIDRDAPFAVDEYRTLNRCLDNAIANAVSEFSYQRDFAVQKRNDALSNERIGEFSQDLRTLLSTASLAFAAAKAGGLNLSGATGTILERSLTGLAKLIDNSLDHSAQRDQEVRSVAAYSLQKFINEAMIGVALTAAEKGCVLVALPVDPKLAIVGHRDGLLAAVSKLLQNAIKFTQPGTEVTLTAYSAGDRVLIDVKDNCGGLKPNGADGMFQPKRSDAGESRFGLMIARQAVFNDAGDLTVTDTPGVGCVFTISLPRHVVLN